MDGTRLAVEATGDGPVGVAVHGVGGTMRDWDTLASRLAGRRVVRYDQRGFGSSSVPSAPYAFSELVDDLATVCADLGPVDVVGHSMGAMVALAYALEHPVRSLVLASATAHQGVRASAFAAGMAYVCEVGFDEALREEWIGALVDQAMATAGASPDALDEIRTAFAEPDAGQALAWRAMSGFSVKDRVPSLACPVLVVHGSDDPLVPIGAGRWIGEHVDGARFVEFEGAGHSIQDDPRFLDEVTRFLAPP